MVEGVVRRYIGELFACEDKPDTLLLGCTHFPLLQKAIANVVGPDVAIVDSARTTAEAVAETLETQGMAAQGKKGSVRFMATDNVRRFAATGGLFLGRKLDEKDVELVDI